MNEVWIEIIIIIVQFLGFVAGIYLAVQEPHIKEAINNFISERKSKSTKEEWDAKIAIAEQAVNAADQIFGVLDKSGKFDYAFDRVIEGLNNSGINITEDQTKMLVESAVKGKKQADSLTDTPKEATEEVSTKQVAEGKQPTKKLVKKQPEAKKEA